jgi:hypothetical protein
MSTQVFVFSNDVDGDRQIARALGLSLESAGGGWLLFTVEAGQCGQDGAGSDDRHQLYLRWDDLDKAVAALAATGIALKYMSGEGGARFASITLPGGGVIRLEEAPIAP